MAWMAFQTRLFVAASCRSRSGWPARRQWRRRPARREAPEKRQKEKRL